MTYKGANQGRSCHTHKSTLCASLLRARNFGYVIAYETRGCEGAKQLRQIQLCAW